MIQKNKIRVLEVVNDLKLGGIEKLVHDLVFNIDPQRFSVEVCCVREKAGSWLRPIEEQQVPVHFFGNYRNNPVVFFSKYNALLKEQQFEVVHVHLNHYSGLFLYHPHLNQVKLCVAHYHSDFTRRNSRLIKRLFLTCCRNMTDRYANSVIGISDACLDSVYGHQKWQQRKYVKRIYNGIKLQSFAHTDISSNLADAPQIDSDSFVIGHVGRFRKEKNHTFIVEIAEKLCARNANIVFLLVGDGPLLDDIKESVWKKRLADHFIFTGARTDVPHLMSLMDIFIFPSFWEGFGLVMIEAQAAGLPVLASDRIPMEIPLENCSRRISLSEVKSWVTCCEQLIKKKEKCHSIQPAGELLKKFSMETWIAKIEELYVQGASDDRFPL